MERKYLIAAGIAVASAAILIYLARAPPPEERVAITDFVFEVVE